MIDLEKIAKDAFIDELEKIAISQSAVIGAASSRLLSAAKGVEGKAFVSNEINRSFNYLKNNKSYAESRMPVKQGLRDVGEIQAIFSKGKKMNIDEIKKAVKFKGK